MPRESLEETLHLRRVASTIASKITDSILRILFNANRFSRTRVPSASIKLSAIIGDHQ